MDNRTDNRLLAVYAALLRLYPLSFRRQFGAEMLETFSELLNYHGPVVASLLILREFFPTLLREHLDDPSSIGRLIRGMLCPIPVLIIYAASIARVENVEEFALSTFWLICILAAFWNTGCRGVECLLRTMGASVLAMLLQLALINGYQPMIPGFLSLAVPFGLLSMTVGLVLAVLARLIMEGINLKAAA